MAKADKLFLLLAVLVVGSAAGAIGVLYGSNDDSEFDDTPIELESADSVGGSGIQRSAGPGRRKSSGPSEETVKPKEKIEVIVAEEGTIVGTVLDHEDKPLPEVEVKSTLFFPYGQLNYGLVNKHTGQAMTNEEGRFSINVPGNGMYRVSFKHLAFAPHIEKEVKAGADLKVKLEVAGAVSGEVKSKESGKAIAGAKLVVRQNKGSWTETGVTDKEGKFTLYGLYSGELYISVSADDFLPEKDRPITVKKGEIAKVNFELSAGRSIKGIVQDKKGTWIPHAKIKVGGREVDGDDFGRFRIGGLEQKAHYISVHAPGFLTHSRQVSMAGSRMEADLKIELDRGATLNISVMDEKGNALPDVSLKVFESWGANDMWDTGNTRYKATTDENGRASISGLDRQDWSQYRIRATATGWADTFSKQFKLKQDQKEKDFTLVMRSGGSISGTVTDETGARVKGVKITLSPSNVYEWSSTGQSNSKSVLTDEKGAFTFGELSARKYRVSAMARGYATQYKSNLEVVGSANMQGVDFLLKDGGIVKGSVKQEDGTPIPEATIQIRSKRSWGHGKTDKDGNYEITNLGEGPYTATARAAGFSFETKKKVFPVEDKIDFELRPDGYAWGVVTDKVTEKPVKQYRVELQKEQGRGGSSWRTYRSLYVNDRAGKFKIFAPDGTYRLVIKSKGHTEYKKDAVAISVTAEPDEMKIKLTPGGAVEGWVRDNLGQGMSYTAIYVRKANAPEGTKFTRKGNTETDGYFFVDSLETGNYEFAFERRGRLPLTLQSPVGVFGGELTNLSISGGKPTAVLVSAKTEDEKQVNWTQVRIESIDGVPIEMRRRGWSNNGANYEFNYLKSTYINRNRVQNIGGLPPGNYRITARYGAYLPFEEEFELREGSEMNFEIVFKKRKKKKS